MPEHIRAFHRPTFVLWFLAVLLAALAVNRFAPAALHADTLLFPIMSMQHVTPFLWGQDRLLNVVPFLFAPVGAAHANLAAHLFAFALSFFLLLCIAAHVVVKMHGDATASLNVLLAFAIALVSTLVIFRPAAWLAF